MEISLPVKVRFKFEEITQLFLANPACKTRFSSIHGRSEGAENGFFVGGGKKFTLRKETSGTNFPSYAAISKKMGGRSLGFKNRRK